MKRLFAFLTFLVTAALMLAACGSGGGSNDANKPGSGGIGGVTSGGGGPSVTPGASGIKDASLLGKWSTADGASAYSFKDDFSVIITAVGADTTSHYNITSGGNGAGKVEIDESGAKVTWDYKITGDVLDLTTPEGRAKKLRKM
ncbi:MAG: hypothetical protein M1434_14000 [Chloroflexi bacterium]|nr:hypothetical protein [Chloroflexota bacterium]MCL5275834.1 hypothetical protein [Chloroflexota bacterium]